MSITSLKYSSLDNTSLIVTKEDGGSYSAPWPCFTWHAAEIQEAIDSGMQITPFQEGWEIKVTKQNLIKSERDRRLQQGGYKVKVGTTNKWFHSDQFSRGQQIGLVQLGANIPADLQWKTMDGSFVPVTQTLAQQILAAGALSDTTIFAYAEKMKAELEASETPESFDVNSGWPVIFGE